MEPASEWIVHLVYNIIQSANNHRELTNRRSYLDIGEVGPDNTVHDTPNVRDGVLVANLNTKLFANEAASTLTTEQVLGANGLDDVGVQTLEVNLYRICLV